MAGEIQVIRTKLLGKIVCGIFFFNHINLERKNLNISVQDRS